MFVFISNIFPWLEILKHFIPYSTMLLYNFTSKNTFSGSTVFVYLSRGNLCLHYFFISSQAFAWWPDLLAEHAEKFWALFTVDMDTALEAQPQDSWDSFPLFQLLNNFLRNDGKHVHFLLYYRKRGKGRNAVCLSVYLQSASTHPAGSRWVAFTFAQPSKVYPARVWGVPATLSHCSAGLQSGCHSHPPCLHQALMT